jgi:hypothetical protein
MMIVIIMLLIVIFAARLDAMAMIVEGEAGENRTQCVASTYRAAGWSGTR